MKVIVTETAFYNKKLVEEGEIIEIKEKEVPSWAKKVKDDKTPKQNKEEEELNDQQSNQKQNIDDKTSNPKKDETNDDNDTLKTELELLKDIAIDNNVLIQIDENASVKENIENFKNKLKENGIEV